MSRCARCGLPNEGPDISPFGRCYSGLGSDRGDLECSRRELANLRSLLRSVTGNLERAADLLSGDTRITIDDMRAAAREVDTALEALS